MEGFLERGGSAGALLQGGEESRAGSVRVAGVGGAGPCEWRSGRRLMPHYRGRPRRRCSWSAVSLLPLRQVVGAVLLVAA